MLLNLQALRALAACLVVMVHLDAVMMVAGWSATPTLFGNCGVDLFFVLSGFLMVHSVARKPVTPGAFLFNRMIRVVPLYWLFTFAVCVIAIAQPKLLGATQVSVPNLIRSLLFVPYARANGLAEPILFLGWTLNYEMFFYLLFGVALVRPRAQGGWAALAIVALVCAGAVLKPTATLPRFYTNPIMLEFVFGMALAWLLGQSRAVPLRAAWALLLIGVAVLIGRYLVLPLGERAWWSGIPAAAMLAGAISLERHGVAWRLPGIQLLGAASYSLYLVHPFVAQALSKLIIAYLGDYPACLDAGIVVIFAGTILVAVAVHRFVELPITAGFRRRGTRSRLPVERHDYKAVREPAATTTVD